MRQSLRSALLARRKLRRFKRVMSSSVPRMTAGASHSDYHIDDNYTQLSVLGKLGVAKIKNMLILKIK